MNKNVITIPPIELNRTLLLALGIVVFILTGVLSLLLYKMIEYSKNIRIESFIADYIKADNNIDGPSDILSFVVINNRISDIKGISQCLNIKYLDLTENRISDVSPISELKGLEELYLAYNRISNIEDLGTLPELVILDLKGNSIKEFHPLGTFDKLQELDLEQNQITSFNSSYRLTSLRVLSLSNNKLFYLNSLKEFEKLEDLNLEGNRIEDLSSLLHNGIPTSLKRINLIGNPLSQNARKVQIPELQEMGIKVYY